MHSLLLFFLTVFHKVVSLLPNFISSRIYAAMFSVKLTLGVPVSDEIIESEIELSEKQSIASVFTTQKERPVNIRTMVVVHGLSMTGHRDPRIVNVAKALAATNPNHLVIVPYLRELAEVDLAANPIDRVREVLETIATDADLCPTGRLSILSPCISAGFCIVAASYVDFIDAMLLIGPHADVHNVLKHAIKRKGKGDCRYGIYAVLASFQSSRDAPLSRILAAYCHDDHLSNLGFENEANQLLPLLEKYPEEAKEYKRIREDGEYSCKRLMEVYEEHKEELQNMSSVSRLDEVKVPYVSLVHSSTDEIVPPQESIILRDGWANRRDMTVSCIITRLLNHGDQEPLGLKNVAEICRCINCFSLFFRSMEQLPSYWKKSV